MRGIFISYRRDDSDVAAGRLADDLAEIFGPDLIFRDIDRLEPGEDYEKALDHALDSCVALIAVIGPRWLTITDDTGSRRLADPKDWVRNEIGRALARGIRVIPALLSGTAMPRKTDLPLDLESLLSRQALELSDRHWRQDLELLAQALERILGIARHIPEPTPFPVPKSKVNLIGSKQRWPLIKAQMVVFLDDNAVGRMKVSDDLTIEAAPGTHNIYLRMTLGSSNTVGFELQPGQTRSFIISQTFFGLSIKPSNA